ncbi:hypothetical protein H7Y63_00480 [Polaromonas sp.]|nr:hypothetical protein [Candidatus Saccharibacteria bacterium]
MTEPTQPRPGLLDNETRARLYFYDQLASHFPGTQRIRRERQSTGIQKVPKDAIDLFLKRLRISPTTNESTAAKSIPVKMMDEPTSTTTSGAVITPSDLRDGLLSTELRPLINVGLVPFNAVKRLFKHFRSDRYLYVANDAGHTSARRLIKSSLYRPALISLIMMSLLIASVGTFVYFRQQAINNRQAAEQSQFEQQRRAWLCALDSFQQTQGKQLSQEATCSK